MFVFVWEWVRVWVWVCAQTWVLITVGYIRMLLFVVTLAIGQFGNLLLQLVKLIKLNQLHLAPPLNVNCAPASVSLAVN